MPTRSSPTADSHPRPEPTCRARGILGASGVPGPLGALLSVLSAAFILGLAGQVAKAQDLGSMEILSCDRGPRPVVRALLVLPAGTVPGLRWDVYATGSNDPVVSFDQTSTTVVRIASIPWSEAVGVRLVLVVKDAVGLSRVVATRESPARQQILPLAAERSVGVLCGAVAAVFGILMQQVFSGRFATRRTKVVLAARFAQALDELSMWNGNRADVPSLPTWVTDPANSSWLPEVREGRFGVAAAQFQDLLRRTSLGSVSVERYQAELREISQALAKPKTSFWKKRRPTTG